jgi:hypothetical protein
MTGAAAELEVLSSEQSRVSPGDGTRSMWQVRDGSFAAPAQNRRVLATSLHQLLNHWRAAEREVADADQVDRYRVEYQRIFGVIRGLAVLDELDDGAPFESLD